METNLLLNLHQRAQSNYLIVGGACARMVQSLMVNCGALLMYYKTCYTCPSLHWSFRLLQYFTQYRISTLSWGMCSMFCNTSLKASSLASQPGHSLQLIASDEPCFTNVLICMDADAAGIAPA